MNKIIFSIFIIVFLFKTGNVFSSNDIFYVDNIIVKDGKRYLVLPTIGEVVPLDE